MFLLLRGDKEKVFGLNHLCSLAVTYELPEQRNDGGVLANESGGFTVSGIY